MKIETAFSKLLASFTTVSQLFHIVSSFVAEICKWGSVLVAQFFLIHYVPAYVTLSHIWMRIQAYNCTNVFFSKLSFTKPVLHPLVRCRWLVALQFLPYNEPSTGCMPWPSKEPHKLFRNDVLLKGEIASMTSVWIVWRNLWTCHMQTYLLQSMSLVRRCFPVLGGRFCVLNVFFKEAMS